MRQDMISVALLERKMQLASDTKKGFTRVKDTGFWHWYNRGDEATLSEPFPTFLAALNDAVEPYED